MISPKQLFINRLKNEWIFNFKVFKTSFDWLIGIYILVPLLLVGLYNYFSLWGGIYDVDFFSLYITVYFILYLYSWTGDIRSFIEFGDQIYLRQKEGWIRKLRKIGIAYSLINSMITTVLVFLLLAPFLIVYLKISYLESIILLFFIYIFRLDHMYIKQFISLYYEGWKRIFVFLITIIISFLIYAFLIFYLNRTIELIIAVFMLILLFYQLHSKKLTLKWSFYEDCIREQNQKIKYARYLLQVSSYFNGPVIKKKKRKKRKLWLFRNSATLFRNRNSVNSLIELYIKIILRNKSNIFALLQITSVFVYGITITDNWLKIGVWFFHILIILKYLKDTLYVSDQNPFLKFYPIKDDLRTKASRLSIFYISLPSILLTSFITGYDLLSLYIGLIFILIGIVISYFAVKVIID